MNKGESIFTGSTAAIGYGDRDTQDRTNGTFAAMGIIKSDLFRAFIAGFGVTALAMTASMLPAMGS